MKNPLESGWPARALLTAFLSLLAITPVFHPIAAHAAISVETLPNIQQTGDFVLEPGKIEVDGNPGDTFIRTISVTSRVKGTTKFQITTEDFIGSQDPNNTIILLGEDKSPYSFKDNLSPEVTDFSLNFGQRITIPVTISIPTNAQPGGYYATALISNAPTKDAQPTIGGARVISRLGALFFVRVNGKVDQNGKLDDFRIKGPAKPFYTGGPFTFQILFNNTGSVHLVPYGVIDIFNMAGKQVAELPVSAYFSMPKSLRYRDIAWDGGSTLIGRYTATVHLNRGYASTTDDMTIAFWVLPWRMIALILIPVIVLAFIIYLLSFKFELKRKG